MNIHNALPLTQAMAGEVQVSGVEKASSARKPSVAATAPDNAELSGAASLASQAASLPDVRTEKVEAVKAALADGSYNVESQNVAQSMMDHMLGKE